MKKIAVMCLVMLLMPLIARAQWAPVAPQTTTPGTFEGSHVFSGGKLIAYSVTWHLAAAANHWIMVFDATALPGNGAFTAATPLRDCQYVNGSSSQTDGSQNYDYTMHPLVLQSGVVIAMSTTNCQSLTVDGANNWFKVQTQ